MQNKERQEYMKIIELRKVITFVAIFVSLSLTARAESLYDLKTNWRDTANSKTGISVNAGSYTLVTMIYTKCAHACPMTISKLQSIEKDFSKINFNSLKFTLASFDVANDRPESLRKYQALRKLDSSKWKMLAAESEEDARQLAVVLGISYKNIGEGDFSHSNVITLVDPKGEILASISSLNSSSEPLTKALEAALSRDKGK